MKEKLLLVGAGGLGRVALEHASINYDCAFVDDADITEVDGVQVVGKITDIDKLFLEYRKLIVCIGNNSIRESIYRAAKVIGYSFPNIVASSAYISPHAKIGCGCIILNNVVIQNNAVLGDGAVISPGVELHHDSTIGNNVLIYTNSVVRSLTHVGDRAWIGSTVSISTRAVVEADAIINDGSVVAAVTERSVKV